MADISMDTPALAVLAGSKSCDEGMQKLTRAGRLGELAKEIAEIARKSDDLRDRFPGRSWKNVVVEIGGIGKPDLARAERFEKLAGEVSDPELSNYYRKSAAEIRKSEANQIRKDA